MIFGWLRRRRCFTQAVPAVEREAKVGSGHAQADRHHELSLSAALGGFDAREERVPFEAVGRSTEIVPATGHKPQLTKMGGETAIIASFCGEPGISSNLFYSCTHSQKLYVKQHSPKDISKMSGRPIMFRRKQCRRSQP
jgi:hypothetical protein